MSSNRRHIPFSATGSIATKALRLPQLAVLLAMLFVSMQAKAFLGFQQNNALGIVSKKVQPNLQSPNATHVAALFPFQTVPSTIDIEILEEAEIEDELDEYWTQIVSAIFSNKDFYTGAERSRYLHHHAALHNRQTVPYFILYHSWKSYLA